MTLRPCLPLLMAICLVPPALSVRAQSHAAHAPSAPSPGRVELPWHADLLQGLPRHAVSMDVHGTPLQCRGVDLVDVLRRAGAMPTDPLRGAHLARRVEVRARDGYTVVFSLGELDPTLGKQRVYVADECDGRPLPAEAGPARLLIPGDSRPARSARQIQTFVIE
ncbi:hypothetical protein LJR143_002960 [Pseudoxanthomonas sp. LjRoot143]